MHSYDSLAIAGQIAPLLTCGESALQKNAGDSAEQPQNAGTNPVQIAAGGSVDVLILAKEKPGALAGATGLNGIRLCLPEYYAIADSVATAFPILALHWGIGA